MSRLFRRCYLEQNHAAGWQEFIFRHEFEPLLSPVFWQKTKSHNKFPCNAWTWNIAERITLRIWWLTPPPPPPPPPPLSTFNTTLTNEWELPNVPICITALYLEKKPSLYKLHFAVHIVSLCHVCGLRLIKILFCSVLFCKDCLLSAFVVVFVWVPTFSEIWLFKDIPAIFISASTSKDKQSAVAYLVEH